MHGTGFALSATGVGASYDNRAWAYVRHAPLPYLKKGPVMIRSILAAFTVALTCLACASTEAPNAESANEGVNASEVRVSPDQGSELPDSDAIVSVETVQGQLCRQCKWACCESNGTCCVLCGAYGRQCP
jgi:hypothetical protein